MGWNLYKADWNEEKADQKDAEADFMESLFCEVY